MSDIKETSVTISTSDLSAIKQSIRYSEFYPALISKFYDAKTALLEDILANPQDYDLEQLKSGKTSKAYKVLEHKLLPGATLIDLVNSTEDTKELQELIRKTVTMFSTNPKDKLGNMSTQVQSVQVTQIDPSMNVCDLYLRIPRGINLNLKKIALCEGTNIIAQSTFNMYPSEGFTMAFHFENQKISFEPAVSSGMKGTGDLYVYVALEDGRILRDYADNYMDANDLMLQYRG